MEAGKAVPELLQWFRWKTMEHGWMSWHGEKWADSGCILKAGRQNLLMQKTKQGARLAPCFFGSLSHWIDGSPMDGDRKSRHKGGEHKQKFGFSRIKKWTRLWKIPVTYKSGQHCHHPQVLSILLWSPIIGPCLVDFFTERSGSQLGIPTQKRDQTQKANFR